MKKLLVVLMALLFTTGAFAQSTGAKFDYNLFGLAYGAMGSYGSDLKYDYQHIRVVPMFTAGNENIKGVVQFQIDMNYGADESPILARQTDKTKVKQAYLAANDVFMQGLGFTTGLVAYAYPLIADIEGAVTAVSFDFGMGTANLYYLKINEGAELTKNVAKQDDDVQAYILDVTIKTGGIDVRPAFIYASAGKQYGDLAKLAAYIGAVNATGDMGMFDFDVTAAFMSAKTDKNLASTYIDGSAYAFDLGVNVKPDTSMAIGVFGTYTSGTEGKKAKEFGFNQAINGLFGGAEGVPAGRLFILQQGGTQDAGGFYPTGLEYADRTNMYGNMAFGLSFTYTMDKLTLFAQYGYMMYAKKY